MNKQTILLKTLLVTAGLLVGMSSWGTTTKTLYSQNYENETDGSSWVTQNLAPTFVTGDENYGKYIKVGPAGNSTNTRSSYTVWGNTFYGDYTSYVLEFDANFTFTTNNTRNQSSSFAIMADGYKLPSPNYGYDSDYIFKITSTANTTTFSLNEEENTYSMPANVWCHYSIVVNGTDGTATYTITNKTTSASIATGTYNIPEGKSYKAVGMYFNCGRYNSIGCFDNISITTEVDEEVVSEPSIVSVYNGNNRTVTITGGVSSAENAVTTYYTIDGSDPTSSSSVYSTDLNLSENCTLKAVSISSSGASSSIVSVDITVGQLTLNAPIIKISNYNDGQFTATISSDQSSLEYVPAEPIVYYTINGGDKIAYSAPISVPQGSTIAAHVECENYINSDQAEFVTGEILNWPKVWGQDYRNIVNSNVTIEQPSEGSDISNGVLSNAGGNYYVYSSDGSNAVTNANAGFEVYYSAKSARKWMIRSGGMYSYGSGTTSFAIAGLVTGQIVKVTSDVELTAGTGMTRLDNISYPNTWFFEATADGVGKISIARNQYVYTIDVYSTESSAPQLTLDKTTANVDANAAVSFTATLTQGWPEPTIQWYSCDDTEKTNPEAIDGATSNTYSPSTANPGTYYYYVKAENTLGSAESDVITLTVTGVVATPTFTLASFDYEHDGYTITPVCTTEGVTLTYTIGNGEAQPCTSGVPFYAKGGKLVITASKEGWTSASIPENQQYTLNAAPSATSPETLISFNLSSDNGDKNLEHVYKSVTIAGGNNGAIGGIGSGATGKLKLRTNQSGNTLTLNVNEGYKVTKVTVEANSNNSGSGATIGLTSVTVDGGENIVTEPTTFPISSAAAVTYNTGDISAASNIVFTFNNTNITGETNKKNNQIIASITVWYKTPTELAIDEAIADCKANEPSAEFATYIDGGSYASVRDVYVAHTNWQIAQGSNDLTKLIRNAAVVDGSDWGGAYTNHSEQYTGAPDEYYLDRWNATINTNQTIYGVPAGTYIIKAATRASVGTPGTLYVNDGSSDVAKVNQITNVGNTGGDLGNGWSWSEMTFTLTETKDLLIGFWADCSNKNWAGCDDWHMTVLETPATVGANGYTTFASPYALDLTDANRPEGLKAYKATLTGKTLSFTELNQTVAAGTGLLLLGETKGGTYNIPVVATGDAVETALTGVITPTAKQSNTAGDYYFVMKKAKTAEDALTFAPLSTTQEVTIPAGKAYVTVPSTAFTDGARTLGISFDDVTIVDAARLNNHGKVMNEKVYNLQGQRVAQPVKGLYIMNGKKVIIK